MAEKKTTTKKVAKKVATKKTTAKKVVKKTTLKKKVAQKKEVTTKKVTPKKTTAKKKVATKKATTKPAVAKKVVKKTAVKNPAKKSEMGLWSRFWKVFTPNFLTELGQQKSQGKSWGFWFLSNFIFILLISVLFFISQSILFSNFPNKLVDKIPDNQIIQLDDGTSFNIKNLIKNFSLSIDSNYILSSKNVPDPLIIIGNKNTANFYTTLDKVDANSAEFVFILDTKNKLDLLDSKKEFNNFIYILDNKTIFFDGEKNKLQIIEYKKLLDKDTVFPKTINFNSLLLAKPFLQKFVFVMFGMSMFMLYFFLSVIRLINVVFWALIFWAIGAIVRVKNWDFEKSFMAMLHFSFISMLFLPLAFLFHLSIFSYAAIIFSVFFGMNFWEMEKK